MRITHILLAFLVTLIWGVNFTFIKWGLESFPPLMLTALRFFFTALPLIFVLKPPAFSRHFWIYAIGTFVVQYAFVFTAMHLGASAGLTALLLQLQIFITVLLATVFLHESVHRRQLVGMGMGLLGLAVIGANLGGDMPVWAFVCILVAAVGWSFGNIASKQIAQNTPLSNKPTNPILSALRLVVWGGLVASILLIMVSLITEPTAWTMTTFTQASLKSWLSLGFIVYISTLLGFGIWAYLLSQNTASRVMPFALLVPIFGMTASMFLTAETLTWWKGLAMGLILFGLAVGRK